MKALVVEEVQKGISHDQSLVGICWGPESRTPPSRPLKLRREFEAGLKDIGCFKPPDPCLLFGACGERGFEVSVVSWDPALDLR